MRAPTRYSAWAFLLGTALGFFIMTYEGHRAAKYSKPSNLKRFHQRLSPDAYFYPTHAMMEKLATTRLSPGKILVIIGGNSVLNGVGQPESELWSLRLQELLGPSYVVVNLSLRGGAPAEGAALVAEALIEDGIPVIYIANTLPTAGQVRSPQGVYGYLYWQAKYSNRLAKFPERDTYIDQWLDDLPQPTLDTQHELMTGGLLEACFRAQSLWLHIGYRHFFTVHTGLLANQPWVARDQLPDNEQAAPPLADRFQDLEQKLNSVRWATQNVTHHNAARGWYIPKDYRELATHAIEATFTEKMRPRTLILLIHCGSYHLKHLTDDERLRDRMIYREYAELLNSNGIKCVET